MALRNALAKRTVRSSEITMTTAQWRAFEEALKHRAAYFGDAAGTAVLTSDGPDILEREDVRVTWRMPLMTTGPDELVRLKLEWTE